MRVTLDNPVIVHPCTSLEKEERKIELFINKLIKRNLRKIAKENNYSIRPNVIVHNNTLYY